MILYLGLPSESQMRHIQTILYNIIFVVLQERYCEVKSLALWLANASELLHFLKSDRHVSAFSLDAQDTLADAVQIAFRSVIDK